jgi:chromosome partitioning protein
MRTVAIINQKGGCGKTTTAINLAATLAKHGQRTLLVDMDPQSHCAAGLGIPEQRIEMDIGDAMLAVSHRHIDPTRLLWRAVRNLDLAPSRMRLAGLEASRGGLAELADKDKKLTTVLNQFKAGYEVACIDCPPSIGLLTFNALAAADMVLIPVETSYFSLQGATRQVNTVKTLSRRLGIALPVWILPTIHDQTNAVAIDLLQELHRRFKDKVIPVVVRRDSKLREAASFGQSIIDYAPESTGAEDYARLAHWLLENLRARSPEVAGVAADHEPLPHEEPVQAAQPEDQADSEDADEPSANPAEPSALPAASAPDVKPISRAEDVARRAQEFLRRVALGRSGGIDTGLSAAQVPVQRAEVAPADPTPSLPAPNREAESTSAEISATAIAPPIAELVAAPATSVLRLVESPRPTQVDPSTQRVLGIRETNQGVLFVQPLTLGDSLAIAGSFNDWSGASHPMKANHDLGVWELCLKLPPGKLLYRLVIDGQWCTDPYNDTCEPNPFGETNSAFEIGATQAAAPAESAD